MLAVVIVVSATMVLAARQRQADDPDHVDCAQVKCVALTFDDGPTPFTDRLLHVLQSYSAKATFFLIGNKVAADPAAARRIADAGMEIGNHTWEHPNMSTIPLGDIASQLSKGTQAIAAATGRPPQIYRPAGGLSSEAVRASAAQQGLAEILWDVIPFDWINDANTAATVYMLKTQIKPGSVVLLHDTYSSTVDVVYQFLPVNRPAFDAHLLPWEGACHAEQVRPGDAGEGGPSGAGASGGLSERVGGDHRGVQAVGDERRDAA
jgi:peptidoglycan/xylan/chitin deacetylase (PgdA/CDA1 family)